MQMGKLKRSVWLTGKFMFRNIVVSVQIREKEQFNREFNITKEQVWKLSRQVNENCRIGKLCGRNTQIGRIIRHRHTE